MRISRQKFSHYKGVLPSVDEGLSEKERVPSRSPLRILAYFAADGHDGVDV